jgi:SAM-dependent methyltransferase
LIVLPDHQPPDPHASLYSKIADWYVRTYYDDLSDLDWLQSFMNEAPACSVIADVGCGPGQYAHLFRDKGFSVISIDLAEGMLRHGVKLDPRLVPVVADIRRLPLRNGCIGGLFAGYTLEHIHASEIDAVLADVHRVLSTGGTVGLSIKCGTGTYEFQSQHGDKGFVQLWLLDDLSEHLHAAGFDVMGTHTKATASPEEFNHDRGFVLAKKKKQ